MNQRKRICLVLLEAKCWLRCCSKPPPRSTQIFSASALHWHSFIITIDTRQCILLDHGLFFSLLMSRVYVLFTPGQQGTFTTGARSPSRLMGRNQNFGSLICNLSRFLGVAKYGLKDLVECTAPEDLVNSSCSFHSGHYTN